MKALIDRTTYKVPVPNFGLFSKHPIVYFIEIPINLELQRFLCPVDFAEFDQYLTNVLGLPNHEAWFALSSIEEDNATEYMAKFLNEKSKDWYPVDENNEPLPIDNIVEWILEKKGQL